MILAVDVDYRDDHALVAGVCFCNWGDESPVIVLHTEVTEVADYEPGQFYKREMPCIIKLLKDHSLNPDLIVIDGFVVLGEDSKPGLGTHLYNALGRNTPVIGVAKTAFKGSKSESEVFRGESVKPLYVTAIGIKDQVAKRHISSMHGKYRIPTLLKLVDSECRKS
jgi:deoxyribonuclease V